MWSNKVIVFVAIIAVLLGSATSYPYPQDQTNPCPPPPNGPRPSGPPPSGMPPRGPGGPGGPGGRCGPPPNGSPPSLTTAATSTG